MHNFQEKRGIGLAEVIISVSIIAAFFIAIFSTHTLYLKTSFSNINNIKASFLLEEGIEAVKTLRDVSWTTNILPLDENTKYYLSWNGTAWQITTTSTFIDSIFERYFVVNNVNRDNTTGDITTSSGTQDSGTKKITIYVSWFDRNATTTKSVSTYISNIF